MLLLGKRNRSDLLGLLDLGGVGNLEDQIGGGLEGQVPREMTRKGACILVSGRHPDMFNFLNYFLCVHV